MPLALFDLDNTLLAGDSDYLWSLFLVEQGIVDSKNYERENQRFYDQYLEGCLDIDEFLQFQLKPLGDHPRIDLERWRAQFIKTKIAPIILPSAVKLIENHRKNGDTPLIITATNRFITGPIANLLGIDHLLATEPEIIDGEYTGAASGTPCFQEGKVTQLNDWLHRHNESLSGSWFYSDSHNDIPLLEIVENPVAVDPDSKLKAFAQQKNWQIISLRE